MTGQVIPFPADGPRRVRPAANMADCLRQMREITAAARTHREEPAPRKPSLLLDDAEWQRREKWIRSNGGMPLPVAEEEEPVEEPVEDDPF